ncbi:MAG TPA: 1,4-dihydroxy-6-naphthoate synthase [Planctomycetota bacterium]|nr:1,4-dihydroxy-6-naphthoate synthase [Planctomycetota bacterium]
MRTVTIGLSPCPNDTFIFHALLEGIVPVEGVRLEPVFEDVEALNRLALDDRLDVTKISFHAYGHLRERWTLLDSGSALGRRCGPLVVVRPEARDRSLAEARVGIPGELTTAALLLRLWDPTLDPRRLLVLTFDRILAAVASGELDAGLIIHESRFTYARHGLVERVDLGEWWESSHARPIPLGGIIANRRLGPALIRAIDAALRESVICARRRPDLSREFVRSHAQELEDDVIDSHIALYVNDFTVSLGAEGRDAVSHLLAEAERHGIIPVKGGPRAGAAASRDPQDPRPQG